MRCPWCTEDIFEDIPGFDVLGEDKCPECNEPIHVYVEENWDSYWFYAERSEG